MCLMPSTSPHTAALICSGEAVHHPGAAAPPGQLRSSPRKGSIHVQMTWLRLFLTAADTAWIFSTCCSHSCTSLFLQEMLYLYSQLLSPSAKLYCILKTTYMSPSWGRAPPLSLFPHPSSLTCPSSCSSPNPGEYISQNLHPITPNNLWSFPKTHPCEEKTVCLL